MKKLLLVFAILFFSLTIVAQNKISGFGKLQLGMTINDIPELLIAKKITTSEQYYSSVYNNTSMNNYEVVCDTLEKSPQGTCDMRVREFQLGRFYITESIELKDIKLKFFNDTLYSIITSDSKLDDLITAKYGSGVTTVKEKDHIFQNGYGATFVKTDQTFTTTWDTNISKVFCYYTFMSKHNNRGEKSIISFTHLHNITHVADIIEENNKVKGRISQRITDSKKKDLDDF